MSFEFSSPRPAAEMRLKCCGTQILDCKGVYCSANNAAVPLGIKELGVRRTGPDKDKARHGGRPETAAAFLALGVVAQSAPEASPALSSSLVALGPLSSLSFSPPAPASPSLPALAPSPSLMSQSLPSAAAVHSQAVQPITIPRTTPVEDVHARHVKVHELTNLLAQSGCLGL